MDINKIVTIFVWYKIFGMDFVFSLPTFSSEHVHIKVYLSPKFSTTKNILKLQYYHLNHKLIHHYHHYKRPVKMLSHKETLPVLENLYLAELDKPYGNAYLRQIRPETQSNNPKSKGLAKYPVETFTLIESNRNHDDTDYKLQNQENEDHRIERHKFDEENPKAKHLEEVIKVINVPISGAPSKDLGQQAPQVVEVVNEEPNYLSKRLNNHNYDITYDYLTPEETQSFRFQEVAIFPQIPHMQSPRSGSTVIIEKYIKCKPLEGSLDDLQQETQNIKYTSMVSTDEEQISLRHITDYQRYLSSPEKPPSFNDFHGDFFKLNLANIDSNKKIDHSHDEENPEAAETFQGYDSYRAAHVQGLGSGGYSNHKLA